MSKITALLNAIEADLISADIDVPAKNIEITPGKFGSEEVSQESFKAPALRIAFLGAQKSEALADATRRFECSFAVFILTDGRDRITDGIEIMEAVAQRIEVNQFSKDLGVSLPKGQRMQTIYTEPLKRKAVSINAVAWSQSVRIGNPDSIAGPADASAIIPDGTDLTQDITQLPVGV